MAVQHGGAAGRTGGDTWNDLLLDKRSGGSVWNPGSYDPELNLVYFGAAPTYDTQPLRPLVPGLPWKHRP